MSQPVRWGSLASFDTREGEARGCLSQSRTHGIRAAGGAGVRSQGRGSSAVCGGCCDSFCPRIPAEDTDVSATRHQADFLLLKQVFLLCPALPCRPCPASVQRSLSLCQVVADPAAPPCGRGLGKGLNTWDSRAALEPSLGRGGGGRGVAPHSCCSCSVCLFGRGEASL